MSGIHPQLTVMLRKAHNAAVRRSADAKHGERHIKTKHLRLLEILHPFIFFATKFSMNIWYSSSAHCDAPQSTQSGSKTKRRAKHGK